jgi:Uma2 family endonuclease
MASAIATLEREPLLVHTAPGLEMDDHDLFRFCQANRDLRIERTAKGDLIIMPPTTGGTSRGNTKLTTAFENWAVRDGSGVVFDSSGGFILPNGAMRSPDVAWVKQDRLDALDDDPSDEFVPICPDFVLELRSSSDSMRALKAKMVEYLSNGARLGWLLDPLEKQVYVCRPGKEPKVLNDPKSISGDPILRGFQLELEPIWAATRRLKQK